MRRKKLVTLLLAGVTAIGTMAPAVPAMATEIGTGSQNQTDVSLHVEAKNVPSYEITVPSATTLNADGSATELKGGITVYGANLAGDVKVEATSQNDWSLKSGENQIMYDLIDTESGNVTSVWTFDKDQVNAAGNAGINKKVSAKADETDIANAEAGDYTDVITFTASVEESQQKEYVRVTPENMASLLKADAEKGDPKVYVSEEEAQKKAAELQKNSNKRVIVIYGYDWGFKMVDGDSTTTTMGYGTDLEMFVGYYEMYIPQ